MQRDVRAYLWDMREAADAIQAFITGVDFKTYRQTPLIHSAVERKFEIIGEAMNMLSKIDPDLAKRIPEYAEIIAFRNLLIHGYASVDHSRVWRIIQASLPGLRAMAAKILDELESG